MMKRLGLGLVGLSLMVGNVLGEEAVGANQPAAANTNAAVVPPPDPMRMNLDELMVSANNLRQQGDTNAALNMLMVYHQRSLQESAGRVSMLLNALLDCGKLPEAERVYQDNMAQTDRLQRDYLYLLHQYYVRRGDKPALLAWVNSLQSRPLPPDMRVQAFDWLVDVSREIGPAKRVVDLVPQCVSNFPAATSRAILAGIINSYQEKGDNAAVENLLNAVERAGGQQPELRQLVTSMRIVRLFAAARWKEAEEKFVKEAPELPDADLLTCFQQAQLGVVKAKQLEMWDRLCAWIVKEQKAKPRVWQAAAYSWLENVRAMNKAATEFPARLEIVQRLEGDPNVMLALYYIYSDPVMKDNNSANLQTMIKIGEKLSDKFKAPQEKELCACKIAEYHFLLQDYDAALRPFKKPLVAMEPKEQETVVNKIKAHQADKKGDYQEAIKYFRAFMENVKQWTSPEVSPFLDITFSKEMALGLSAKRIGDCYQKMKDSAKAQAAYQEADGYYVIAEKEFKDKKAESEYVKKCRAELAALLKK